jgi:glutathione-specific gamma-glutamylcyclotransferase
MSQRLRKLSLTPAHVARVHRDVADTGPVAGVLQPTDADYAAWVARIIATHPAPELPTQLFAYGSLIWKPEIDFRAEQIGVARGWHRSFCLRQHRFRGTPDRPGLMMALDRGGQCKGVLFELPVQDMEQQFDRLFRREFTVKPINSMPRWISVETAGGRVHALGFVMNRASPDYVGRMAPQDVAHTLAAACAHWGSGAEYLMNTVAHLQARGIHDSNLWRLQRLVAACIDTAPPQQDAQE